MSERYGADPRTGAAACSIVSMALLYKTIDTMQYALHLSIRLTSFCVGLVLSHLLFNSVATMHECTVEETFSFESPVHPRGRLARQGHIWWLSQRRQKMYISTQQCTQHRIHLHTVDLSVQPLKCDMLNYGSSRADGKATEHMGTLVLSYS